jgi:excisionase family DNA binding protein
MANLLTIAQTCELLQLSRPTIRRLTGARKIPFVRIGHAVRFPEDELVAWIDSHKIPVTPAVEQGALNTAKAS